MPVDTAEDDEEDEADEEDEVDEEADAAVLRTGKRSM